MGTEKQNAKETLKPHSKIGRILHWVTGLLVIYGYAKGLRNVSQLEDHSLWLFEVAFSLFLGACLALRYYWMHKHNGGASRLPENSNKLIKGLSWIGHNAIYLGLAGIIITGLLIAAVFYSPLAGSFIQDGFIGLHNVFVFLTGGVMIGHVAAALLHKYWLKDGIMETMTSWKK